MRSKGIRPLLIGAFLAGLVGVATNWITLRMTAEGNRRDVAHILLPEVRSNERRAKTFGAVHLQIVSGQPITLPDGEGNVITLDWSNAEVLPGSFSFSIFESTLNAQARLDADLLDTLHTFYRLLRQAERFREASIADDAPQRKAGYLKDVFKSSSDAGTVARERRLTERLEQASQDRFLHTLRGFVGESSWVVGISEFARGANVMPAWAQEWWWTFIVIGLIWTIPWKAIALWRAARRGHTGWFVALLLMQTLGVLDILYLFVFSHRRASHAAGLPDRA